MLVYTNDEKWKKIIGDISKCLKVEYESGSFENKKTIDKSCPIQVEKVINFDIIDFVYNGFGIVIFVAIIIYYRMIRKID